MRYLVVFICMSSITLLKAQVITFGDCSNCTTPCAKNFTVYELPDKGNVRDDLNQINCVKDIDFESNTIWLKFLISKSGTFSFELSPIIASDDIDFIVFNKNSSCKNLKSFRCMTSGKNLGLQYNNYQRCLGKTGLIEKSTDIVEPSGCYGLADNYLSTFNCEKGDTYLILINNYHSNSGFEFNFTGNAEFVMNNYPSYEKSMSVNSDQWTYNITHISTFGFGGCSINWEIKDEFETQSFEGLNVYNIKFKIPGNKTVIRKITNVTGCESQDTSIIQVSTISTNPKKKAEVSVSEVYPNPAKNSIYIELLNPNQKILNFNITSIEGKQVTELEKLSLDTYQVISKKLDNFTPGVYFINLYEKNGKKLFCSKKFIVEK